MDKVILPLEESGIPVEIFGASLGAFCFLKNRHPVQFVKATALRLAPSWLTAPFTRLRSKVCNERNRLLQVDCIYLFLREVYAYCIPLYSLFLLLKVY